MFTWDGGAADDTCSQALATSQNNWRGKIERAFMEAVEYLEYQSLTVKNKTARLIQFDIWTT